MDGVPGRRISGLHADALAGKLGVRRRSRPVGSSEDRLRFGETLGRDFGLGALRLHMSVQVPSSASEASSAAGARSVPRSSGIGRNVPPRKTVSTAAWHTCQFPVHKSPTAPFTGFTVRPHASNNNDWNKAKTHQPKPNQNED
jgi:hypothetical protein